MILLGFEIGSGKRVEIPDTGHLAWFGQTQLSGKTTALEAIAFRGGLRAVAFITKQGEGGFLTGRMIPPYFSEPTNDEEQPLWRWVKSILEASQTRKMNFEESWIIRACEDPRPAKTLADVHTNIKALISGEKGLRYTGSRGKKKTETKWIRKPVSGINAGVYTSLKAYFDIVMPQLARLPYTKKLELHPGLNVMNLQEYAMETQALVIRSVMEWVYLREKNTRVIVPEAQDFVPQGKNSPVKMACETLVRKAGANKNFMWLDSQDMAAVDKIMLRACSIVGIGVQTEGHEIDRSLASLFTPQLKAVDIARLKIGEFFVRTPEARVAKCYVMPAWMDSELHAQAIAKGEETVSSARLMLRAFKDARSLPERDSHKPQPEPSSPAPPQLQQIQIKERDEDESHTSNRSGKDSETPESDVSRETGKDHRHASGDDFTRTAPESEDRMWREKYEALQAEHKTLIEAHDALAERVRAFEQDEFESGADIPDADIDVARDVAKARKIIEHGVAVPSNGDTHVPVKGNINADAFSLNEIYKFVKQAAQNDPGVLELLIRKPELRVKVERPVIHANGEKLDGQIAILLSDGFFDKPRDRLTIGNELRRRGHLSPSANLKILSVHLSRLTSQGFLTIEPTGFQAVAEMKVMVQKG